MKFETIMRICAKWCIICFIFSIALFITTNPLVGRLYFLILAVCSILTSFKLEQIANTIKRERLCDIPHKHVKLNIHEHEEGEK